MLRTAIILTFTLMISCHREEKIEIIFGGDVMLDRGVRKLIERNGANYITDGIAGTLHDADFAIVNLECPVTDIHAPETKKFVFRGDPACLPSLRNSNITHCVVANNHSYDQGREGLISTAQNLVSNKLAVIGYGETQQQACAPVYLEKGNIKVAVFSSVTLPLESWMYLANNPGMCQASINDLVTSIKELKKNYPAVSVIVSLHWGVEYQKYPTPFQQEQARELIHAGADAIIGHHPHVVQSFERIEGKPVFYSIGNLIFDNPDPRTQKGILVKLSFGKELGVEIIPYRSDHVKPVIMTGSEKVVTLEELQKVSDKLP